ncbi:hypothetical protein FB550_111217 [Neobacillus bataviensis]|uniref:Uncharacterized protein n=1 Tax=Neobacillus bataviensis TaxID=220685 RepID=A0A561D020_9BACI|nr:hypothetical protein [Neobacillus bataviensis]TWD96557.1 hypothetical protein FB550_111217 [Neobacillus bataviensis]
MYVPGYITQEEEAVLPFFNSHDEALKWFKNKYGKNFILTGTEIIDEQNCHIYYLILDRELYEAGQNEFMTKGIITDAIKYMGSYQEIQVFDDGSIHIAH